MPRLFLVELSLSFIAPFPAPSATEHLAYKLLVVFDVLFIDKLFRTAKHVHSQLGLDGYRSQHHDAGLKVLCCSNEISFAEIAALAVTV